MKPLVTLLKVAATVALFWFVLSRVDLGELASRLDGGDIALALLAGGAILSLQAVLFGARLRICVRALGHEVSRRDAWIACQYCGFFSHTPISFLGGEAMRIWYLAKTGLPVADSAKAVILDRALGFLGMMSLVIATAPTLHPAITDPVMRGGYLLLIGLGTGAALAFLGLGGVRPARRLGGIFGWIADIATVSHYLWARPYAAAAAFLLAVAMNALSPLAIWAIARAYGAEIDFVTAMVASPVVFIVAMIPISVAGWGLREGALVVALGLFGVSAATSLTVSITFGIAVLLAYSPAAVLIVMARRRAATP